MWSCGNEHQRPAEVDHPETTADSASLTFPFQSQRWRYRTTPHPQVAAGLLTVGDLVLVNTLFFQLAGPLNHVGDVYRGISQATTDMENMLRILDEEPRVRCTATWSEGGNDGAFFFLVFFCVFY